jgi:hypothetical protein
MLDYTYKLLTKKDKLVYNKNITKIAMLRRCGVLISGAEQLSAGQPL